MGVIRAYYRSESTFVVNKAGRRNIRCLSCSYVVSKPAPQATAYFLSELTSVEYTIRPPCRSNHSRIGDASSCTGSARNLPRRLASTIMHISSEPLYLLEPQQSIGLSYEKVSISIWCPPKITISVYADVVNLHRIPDRLKIENGYVSCLDSLFSYQDANSVDYVVAVSLDQKSIRLFRNDSTNRSARPAWARGCKCTSGCCNKNTRCHSLRTSTRIGKH